MKLRSWKASSIVAAILFACSLANGQDRRIDLATGNIEISLVLPTEFQPFSEQKMSLVRENGVAAKFVFSPAEEKSQQEIAAVLDCTPKTVEMRLYHARKQLRERLEKLLSFGD